VRIIIAGGSGFLGRALHARLDRNAHSVAILTRRPRSGHPHEIGWTPDGRAGSWAGALEGADAIVNLAGEGIADRRWTSARKDELASSRLLATRSLVDAITRQSNPPKVLVNGSGIGYYGDCGDETVTESTPPGSDFLARLCEAWEGEAEQASTVTRVAIVRSAVVLHTAGGALRKMLLPFKLGIAGRLGSGRQFMPWIHMADWVELVVWLLETGDGRGAFNAVAPTPATNAEFTSALGRVLHRPTLIPVPAFALKLILGELAESLLTGQRAIPARAQEMGFQFRFPDVNTALRDLLH
jgi:uncharacterized protein